MTLQRWTAAGIIEYFVQNPKGKIKISEADMNNWLLNTENKITIPPKKVHHVAFEKKGGGIWEGSLFSSEKAEKGLRFK